MYTYIIEERRYTVEKEKYISHITKNGEIYMMAINLPNVPKKVTLFDTCGYDTYYA